MTKKKKITELKAWGCVYVHGSGWYYGEDAWQGPNSAADSHFLGVNYQDAWEWIQELDEARAKEAIVGEMA